MANPVVVDFLVKGMPDVQRALRGVEAAAAAAERAASRAAQREAQKRIQLADKEAREKIRLVVKADAEQRRAQDRAIRDTAKAAQAGVRAEERAAREKIRIMQKVDAEHRRIQDRAERDTARAHAKEVRQQEQRSMRWVKQREREQRQAANQQAAENKASRERFAASVGQGIVKAGGTIAGGARAVAGMVSTLGGGFSLADSAQRQVNLEREAALLSNAALTPGSKRRDTKEILAGVKASAVTSGSDPEELIKGLSAYVAKSSDFEGGMKNLDFFGKVAKTTGSSIEDVMKTGGMLRVQNKGLDDAKMKDLILSTVMQARLGAVEFEDMAKAGAKITRSNAAWAGDQTDTQRKLLGLAQIGIRTSGSAEEAATVLSNLSGDATKHRKGMAAVLGNDFLNEKGQIAKPPEEFIADVMEKTGGNLTKMASMGFGLRSIKMFQALAPTFNDAEAEALRGGASKEDARKAGRQAVLADIKSVTQTDYKEKNLNEDFGVIMKTSGEQFEGAMRQLRMEVGSQLVPELLKLVPVLRQATPVFAKLLEGLIKLADFAGSNPFAALGTTFTALVAKEVISAQIGETLKRAIMGGGGPGGASGSLGGTPGATPAGAAGGAGGLGPILAVAAGSMLQMNRIGSAVDLASGAANAGSKQGDALAEMARNGQTEAAKAGLAKATDDSSAGNWALAAVAGASKVAGFLPTNMLASYASDKVQTAVTGKDQTAADEQVSKTIAAEFTTSSKELVTALRENTAATAAKGAGDPSGGPRVAPINARQ